MNLSGNKRAGGAGGRARETNVTEKLGRELDLPMEKTHQETQTFGNCALRRFRRTGIHDGVELGVCRNEEGQRKRQIKSESSVAGLPHWQCRRIKCPAKEYGSHHSSWLRRTHSTREMQKRSEQKRQVADSSHRSGHRERRARMRARVLQQNGNGPNRFCGSEGFFRPGSPNSRIVKFISD